MSKASNLLFLLIILVITSCKQPAAIPYEQLTGETWGTYYRVTAQMKDAKKHHENIKQILADFDEALSTYVPQSAISLFNESEKNYLVTKEQDRYFAPVLQRSRELKKSTDGYMDVTVMPLLNYWGFGYKSEKRNPEDVDSTLVNELRNKLHLEAVTAKKSNTGTLYEKQDSTLELDFSALAKGYGIDIIAAYLDGEGISNYLIDIGGEARATGKNNAGKVWTLAINKPHPDATYSTQELVIELAEKSIATSGNYREMYEVNNIVFGHIVNPKTGYPWPSDVLSATVLADDCMTADGLATACVAAGLEKAKDIIANHKNVSACLIYDGDGDEKLEKYYIGDFKKYVLIEN